MNTRTQTLPLALQLQAKALYSLPDATGLTVTCDEGALWLTVEGDLSDYVLEPGQTFKTQSDRTVLIYALAPSRISIANTEPEPDSAPRRGLRFDWRLRASHA